MRSIHSLPRAPALAGWPVDHLRAAAACLWRWHERSRQRLELANLDEARRRDLGLTRCDVAWECQKPFWRP